LQRALTHNANNYCTDNSWEAIGKQHIKTYDDISQR
jgi:hypothetical protein